MPAQVRILLSTFLLNFVMSFFFWVSLFSIIFLPLSFSYSFWHTKHVISYQSLQAQ
ncbi:hypothetical protein HN51_061296 [Arachis hypogaea]